MCLCTTLRRRRPSRGEEKKSLTLLCTLSVLLRWPRRARGAVENGSVDWKLVSSDRLDVGSPLLRKKSQVKPAALRDEAQQCLQNRVIIQPKRSLGLQLPVDRDALPRLRDGAPTGDVKEQHTQKSQDAAPHRTAAGTPRRLHATTEPPTHHSTASNTH